MSQMHRINLDSRLMDIRLSKEMKALLLDTMSHIDSPKRSVSILHNWICVWDDYESWPQSKIVKDSFQLYKHLGFVHGTDEFARSFVKEMNEQMKWTGVCMGYGVEL